MTLKITISTLILACSILACTSKKKVPIEDIFTRKTESFLINNSKDTSLVGALGTKIMIFKNTFESDHVRLELTEFYSKSDFLKAGLTTTSEGRLIESRGMIHVRAFNETTEVFEMSKDILIQFASDPDENYRIFYGSLSTDQIDWTVDTVTKNYRIIENTVVSNESCQGCYESTDTVGEVVIDSITWKKGYTQFDRIVTYRDSGDTLTWEEFYALKDEAIAFNKNLDRIFKTSRLGWINCDAFTNSTTVKNVSIKINYSGNPYVFAILKNRNSIVSGYSNSKGIFEFGPLPIGDQITILSFDKKRDKLLFGKVEELVVGDIKDITLELKDSDANSIEDIFESLNK